MVDIDTNEGPVKRVMKAIVVGEMGTGKTSIIRRSVHNTYTEFYKSTIGVDFANKELELNGSPISLQLWDIAGQERYGNMTHVYYQEAVAAFVVFDVTRLQTYAAVSEWKADIDSKVFTANNEHIPCILIGNKIDLCPNGWDKTDAEVEEFCREHGFMGYMATSASTGTGIEEAVTKLVKYVVDNNIEPLSVRDAKTVKLEKADGKKQPEQNGKCCK